MSAAQVHQHSPLPRPLPEAVIELITARLRVVAEPTRVRLLGLLSDGDATVGELTEQLATTHQNVSRHLGLLYRAGMISRRKEGTFVRYALTDWTGLWLIEQIGESVAVQLEEMNGLFDPKRGCDTRPH